MSYLRESSAPGRLRGEEPAAPPDRLRWLILSAFMLSTGINYLDRQTFAHLAPIIQAEFHLSDTQYGLILAAFSIPYALAAPAAGMLIDRIGLNRGIAFAVGVWSCAGMATGATVGLGGLAACRAALGTAESAGFPAAGKAIHQYLRPAERTIGNAINQASVSLGAMLAPPLATWIALRSGWRAAFVATGALGLLWIPLWLAASRRAAAPPAPKISAAGGRALLRDPRLWRFVIANALAMVGYSLWTNWTTKFLVRAHGLTVAEAARYAWIPPLAAMAGGFACGAYSMRLAKRGMAAPAARYRACRWAALISLVTFAVPAAPSPLWACAAISASIFAVAGFSVNMYTLPLDVFGGARAAFAVSILVTSYGGVQALISPAFGKIVDLYGYSPVIYVAALTPLAACAVLGSAAGLASRPDRRRYL